MNTVNKSRYYRKKSIQFNNIMLKLDGIQKVWMAHEKIVKKTVGSDRYCFFIMHISSVWITWSLRRLDLQQGVVHRSLS